MSDETTFDNPSDDVRAALNELKGNAEARPETPVAAPEPGKVQASASIPDPEVPVRDDKGRFAPKEAVAKPAETVQNVDNQPGAAESPQETIQPPHSLKAAVKAVYGSLPKEVQEEFLRLEKTFQDGKTEWSSKAERLNRFDGLLTPIKERLALAGTDEVTYLNRLIAADQMLTRDPRAGLAQIAQMYGVDAAQLGMMQPQQAEHPVIAQLTEKLSNLERQLGEQTQAQEQARLVEARQEMEAFRSKPENMYFENVRPAMVQLLEARLADNMQDAYDKAVRLDPEVWPLVQKAQSDAAQKATQAAEHARRALNASGSVTGSPSPGGRTNGTGNPTATVADDVRDAMRELAGRA